MMFLDEVIRAITQIVILSAIPLIVWFFAARKSFSFFLWIGLKKPVISEHGKVIAGIVAAVVLAMTMSSVLDRFLPSDIQLANARFSGKGFAALPSALVFSFLATALPEEILFRGFIGKHLNNNFGFVIGNLVQAVLFGLLHGATLFGTLDAYVPLAVIAITGALGWIMGYINRKADSSIFPSMIIHGLSNIYSCVMIMFVLR